jgi:hypothetical protein
MPANAGIHVFLLCLDKQDVDGRDIGERSGAALRTAMPGHDGADYARNEAESYSTQLA